jgi:putative membrane protein
MLVSTGLMRAFGGLEKGTPYYLGNPVFWHKMTLFAVILLLELWPMAVLIRWRIATARGVTPDMSRARTFHLISVLQTVLLVLMIFAATAMARGVGL